MQRAEELYVIIRKMVNGEPLSDAENRWVTFAVGVAYAVELELAKRELARVPSGIKANDLVKRREMTVPDEVLQRRRERVQFIEETAKEEMRARVAAGKRIENFEALDLLDYIEHLESARWCLRETLRKVLETPR